MVTLNVSTESNITTSGIVEGLLSTHFMITVFYDLILIMYEKYIFQKPFKP